MLAGAGLSVYAQKPEKFDKDKLNDLIYTQKKLDDAKTMIDKVEANPKEADNLEALLYKINIYGAISGDSSLSKKYPDASKTAYGGFEDFLKKQPDTAKANKLIRDNYTINAVSALYANGFNKGRAAFGEKNYPVAYDNFKIAAELGNFVLQNGFSSGGNKNGIDTTTVLYTAYSAQNAEKADDAVFYYKKIADRKIALQQGEGVYQYLIDYYSKKNDDENFKKYLGYAKELYPAQSALWSQFEMQKMTSGGTIDEVLAKYKSADAAGQIKTDDQYAVFAETFVNPQKTKDLDSAKKVEFRNAAIDAYQKAFAINGKQGIYAFNAGILTYNTFDELKTVQDGFRGQGAALKAKRDAIDKDLAPLADNSITWLEKGYEVLKAKTDRDKSETNSLKRCCGVLANLYSWKTDKARGHNPQDVDKFDAKFKAYDAEFSKY